MWGARVATATSYSGAFGPFVDQWCSRSPMRNATSAPPCTARLPPSQKSFWTSTTSSARFMSVRLATQRQPREDVLDHRVPHRPLVVAGPEVPLHVETGGRRLLHEP